MTTLQLNMKKGHKFVFSGLLFGLSVARTVALSLRIAQASDPFNGSLGLAANILVQAGVVIIFVVNLFFTQRVVRATHPKLGWSLPGRIIFRGLLAGLISCLVMIIITVVHTSYTLDRHALQMDRRVQLVGGTYFFMISLLPIPVASLAVLLRDRKRPLEKFGAGAFRVQTGLLFLTATLLALGAGFRLGTNFAVTPKGEFRWWHSKACFYTLNFGVEIICSALYALTRFDQRYHIPNGASRPGDYAKGREPEYPLQDNMNANIDVEKKQEQGLQGWYVSTDNEMPRALAPAASSDTLRVGPFDGVIFTKI